MAGGEALADDPVVDVVERLKEYFERVFLKLHIS